MRIIMSEQEKYLVYRDTSEKKNNGWIFEPSETCKGTVEKNLFTADYSIEGYYEQLLRGEKIFVIERKGSVAEFVSNISQKEKWDDFKQELERLEEFKYPFVICEWPFSCLSTYPVGSTIPRKIWPKLRVTPQWILKRCEEIFIEFKTKFIFTDNSTLGKEIASGLFKRVIEKCPI